MVSEGPANGLCRNGLVVRTERGTILVFWALCTLRSFQKEMKYENSAHKINFPVAEARHFQTFTCQL